MSQRVEGSDDWSITDFPDKDMFMHISPGTTYAIGSAPVSRLFPADIP
jgi:hypothetical protein